MYLCVWVGLIGFTVVRFLLVLEYTMRKRVFDQLDLRASGLFDKPVVKEVHTDTLSIMVHAATRAQRTQRAYRSSALNVHGGRTDDDHTHSVTECPAISRELWRRDFSTGFTVATGGDQDIPS